METPPGNFGPKHWAFHTSAEEFERVNRNAVPVYRN